LDVGSGIFAVDPAPASSPVVVPEPGSIGLLAGGMLGLAAACGWRRARRHHVARPRPAKD
jgi:hypothetical protein